MTALKKKSETCEEQLRRMCKAHAEEITEGKTREGKNIYMQDFMEGVWLMLNRDKPKNYVLASGEMHTIREFAEECFSLAGIKGNWTFENGYAPEDEVFKKDTGEILLRINPEFFRPAEVHKLLGNPSLAESDLGWVRKTDFKGLVKKMYANDYALLTK